MMHLVLFLGFVVGEKAEIKRLKHTKGEAGTPVYHGQSRQLESLSAPVARVKIFYSHQLYLLTFSVEILSCHRIQLVEFVLFKVLLKRLYNVIDASINVCLH